MRMEHACGDECVLTIIVPLIAFGFDFDAAANSHSLTSGSSNQDELLRAYEYARRHPPGSSLQASTGGALTHYDAPDDSHTTGSEGSTDPGIRQFTESPPEPNERRQAACITPGSRVGVFYSIPLTCGKAYVGLTGSGVNDRLREYRNNFHSTDTRIRKPATDSNSPRACVQQSNSQGTYSSTRCFATGCPSYSLKTAWVGCAHLVWTLC
ncbi:hypothetical protein HPB52_022045 [Rhipicephalus sanguineus]|uniref:Uncharacterized protein n=1 Tax=Rhipicephalus sanguineus TaxID=34632 RepID=A0A9D4SWX0_RHISA|nr:hypothetical protein HPB52_022045 [Rhipicephalus sanguineus]